MSIPESHLAQEAIAALVDGELPAGPAGRAARHLAGCLQCRMAVQAQREAKEALHGSPDVAVPGDLLSRLCAIPFTADVPGAGGGLGDAGRRTRRAHRRRQRPAPGRSTSPRRTARSGPTTRAGCAAGWPARWPASALGVTVARPDPARPTPRRRTAGAGRRTGPAPEQHTEVVPPVVRTVTVGTHRAAVRAGPPDTPDDRPAGATPAAAATRPGRRAPSPARPARRARFGDAARPARPARR